MPAHVAAHLADRDRARLQPAAVDADVLSRLPLSCPAAAPHGPALAGAVLASVLWEVAKQLFRLYIRNVGVYDQIYGPLGVLVAFVMFVYYSAIVFVLRRRLRGLARRAPRARGGRRRAAARWASPLRRVAVSGPAAFGRVVS